MTNPPHIVLVGNYPPDGEESMERYAAMLAGHLPAHGFKITLLIPRVIAGRLAGGSAALAKFLGHVDKLVFFPLHLRRFLARAAQDQPVDIVHICDNCNAAYAPAVRRYGRPTVSVVTCHDFFALNGTLGLQPGVRPRLTGRLRQRHVLRGLRQADHLLCVSSETRENLLRLPGGAQAQVTTIPNGLAETFAAPPAGEAGRILGALHPALGARPRGYVFHVGNNHWYKNRDFILEAYFAFSRRLPDPPMLVFAGKKLDRTLAAKVAGGPANGCVLDLGRVDDAQLAALYANAGCLFFPSLAEGFGWPILEAVACRCPVITSARAPMAELAGEAAILIDPTDIDRAAAALTRLFQLPPAERDRLVEAGLGQAAAHSTDTMIRAVGQLYRNLLSPAGARLAG
jgi:glycosyltransferase involved in cell wall biosynthesis